MGYQGRVPPTSGNLQVYPSVSKFCIIEKGYILQGIVARCRDAGPVGVSRARVGKAVIARQLPNRHTASSHRSPDMRIRASYLHHLTNFLGINEPDDTYRVAQAFHSWVQPVARQNRKRADGQSRDSTDQFTPRGLPLAPSLEGCRERCCLGSIGPLG